MADFEGSVNVISGGRNRVHLGADSQRIEIRDSSGRIIAMMGGGSNIRAGTNGEGGDLFLYPSTTTDIFNNTQARIHLDGNTGNLNLRDGSSVNRVHLSAGDQRIEIMNGAGRIIAMMGGGGNIRAGTNGEGGDIFLYPSTATDIFNNGQASIHLNGETGDIILSNADCAEDFEFHDAGVEPGTVVVIGSQDLLVPCSKPYDKCVAGVVSGAGGYKPGIVLDRHQPSANRRPVALVGKVYCRVDAQFGSIEVGDLLTTSSTPGHAMKISDSTRAFGAVIGKALREWPSGSGLIPMLVALQ